MSLDRTTSNVVLILLVNHVESIDNIVIKKYYHCNIPSLVVLPKNRNISPKVLLCGHLDVITHSDSHSYRSHITDGKIIGPGSADMKGPLAILTGSFQKFTYAI